MGAGGVGTTWALVTGCGGGAQDGLGAHQGLVSSCMWLFTVKCWGMLEPGEEYVMPPAPQDCRSWWAGPVQGRC